MYNQQGLRSNRTLNVRVFYHNPQLEMTVNEKVFYQYPLTKRTVYNKVYYHHPQVITKNELANQKLNKRMHYLCFSVNSRVAGLILNPSLVTCPLPSNRVWTSHKLTTRKEALSSIRLLVKATIAQLNV